jgi:hypothetical protein
MQTRPSFKAFSLTAAALLLLSASASSPASQQAEKSAAPVIVLAELQNHKITYKVDGKDALPDLLGALNAVGDQRGRDISVTVLVDARAQISEVGNIDGTLGKAGFKKTRFFVFNREANVMSAIEFGHSIPFSTHPPAN